MLLVLSIEEVSIGGGLYVFLDSSISQEYRNIIADRKMKILCECNLNLPLPRSTL